MSPGMGAAVRAGMVILGAYLLGSVSFSYLIVRAVAGQDVRTVGSGNAGATNAMRAAGKGPAILVLVLDMAKGVAAVAVARLLGAPPAVVGGAALAVVLGHIFPLFFGFRGGKGVATAAGALGALDPLALALAVVVFAVVVAWKRYVSLGSISAAAAFPLLVFVSQRLLGRQGQGWLVAAAAAVAALVVAKHASNLARLRAGTEPRLGARWDPAGGESGGLGR